MSEAVDFNEFAEKPACQVNEMNAPPTPEPNFIPEAMAAKILKALDSLYDSGPNVIVLPTSDFVQILRKHAKGINILDKVNKPDEEVHLRFKESIPVGALFQWAEDQFNWRFIIRDYGIVATDRDNVPPGAVLLLDFWRKSKGPDSAS